MAPRLGFFVGFFCGFFSAHVPTYKNFCGFFVVRILLTMTRPGFFSGENVGRWYSYVCMCVCTYEEFSGFFISSMTID